VERAPGYAVGSAVEVGASPDRLLPVSLWRCRRGEERGARVGQRGRRSDARPHGGGRGRGQAGGQWARAEGRTWRVAKSRVKGWVGCLPLPLSLSLPLLTLSSRTMIASTTAPSALRAPCGHHRAAYRTSVIARVAGKQLTGPRVVKGPVFVTRDVRFGDGRESGSGERGAQCGPVATRAAPHARAWAWWRTGSMPRAGRGNWKRWLAAARRPREGQRGRASSRAPPLSRSLACSRPPFSLAS
jgi:hypothetical protein